MAKAKADSGTLDFEAMFDEYNAANQKVWLHDRSTTVGASEAFDCIRKVWFNKFCEELGLEPDEDYENSWGALRRGDLMEEHLVVPVIRGHMPEGSWAELTGDQQVTLVDDKLSATPDGLLRGLKRDALAKYDINDLGCDSCMLEIKSIDPRATLEHEKEQHYGQVNVQMGLVREKMGIPVQFAVILYVDASFYDKITVFIIEYDDRVYKAARRRANQVFEAQEASELKAEGRLDSACKYCPWRRPCGESILEAIPGKEYQTDDPAVVEEFEAFVTQYKTKKNAKEEAEFEFNEAKDTITNALISHKVSRVAGDFWKVSWSPVKGRKTLDKKAMEADGIDVSEYEVEGTGYDHLSVNFKNEA